MRFPCSIYEFRMWIFRWQLWAGYVATMSETKNEQKMYVGKSLRRHPFRRLRIRWWITVRETAYDDGRSKELAHDCA
jgi:hypothetical protein